MAEYLSLVLLITLSYSLVRARERHFYSCLESYNKLMVGLFCWLAMLLVRIVADGNLFGGVTLFARLEYQYFTEALLLVAGGVFLVLGVTEWIKKFSGAEEKELVLQRHLDLLTAMEMKLCEEQLPDTTLTEIRNILKHFLDAVSVNFYIRSEYSGCFEPAESNSLPLTLSRDREGDFSAIVAKSSLSVIPAEVSKDGMPTAIMTAPFLAGNSGVMMISFPREKAMNAELVRILNLLLITFKTRRDAVSERSSEPTVATVFSNLRRRMAACERVQESIQDIYDSLRQITPCDILRIAIYDARGLNVTQYCLGQGKNLLSERNKSISTQKTHLGQIFQHPELTVTNDLAVSEYADDLWLNNCGAFSAVTIPIISGNIVHSAVTIASIDPKLSLEIDENIVRELQVTLLPLVKSDVLSHQLVAYNRQFLELIGALKRMVSNEDEAAFLKELAESVVRKLPVTYCRFWKYDSDHEMLNFVADAQSRDVHNQITALENIPLSRAKWHKIALESGRTVVINQREERMQMGDQEVLQTLLTGLQSALIVPMTAGNELIGVMTLAELRSWERQNFSLSDSLFARGIANIAAQAVSTSQSHKQINYLGERLTHLEEKKLVNEIFTDLPTRFATPLTSIMARTDRLLQTTGQYDPEALRDLQVIKTQSEKMVNEVRNIQEARHLQLTK